MSRTKSILKGNRCQCTGCGEYFSTESNFDRHRRFSVNEQQRVCVDPASVGLVISNRAGNSFWAMPGRLEI